MATSSEGLAQATYAAGSAHATINVVSGDFDGDSKQDLAITNDASKILGVYLTVRP